MDIAKVTKVLSQKSQFSQLELKDLAGALEGSNLPILS